MVGFHTNMSHSYCCYKDDNYDGNDNGDDDNDLVCSHTITCSFYHNVTVRIVKSIVAVTVIVVVCDISSGNISISTYNGSQLKVTQQTIAK